MAPRPQEQSAAQQAEEGARAAADGDRVVISGMAGLYPQARYVKDLENILYNKLNPVSADDLRWKYNHPEAAQYTGSVPDLDRFDAQFFKVHFKLGKAMDSISRKMLEQAYEAIYDAGVNPGSLSGKKIGVYIGTCFSETEKTCFYNSFTRSGFGIAGCNKSMFANRVSYWLNAKGPSMSIDQACCSSTAALAAAYDAISRGECEAALAGGGNLCLHPQSSVHYGRIMNISKDGTTKSFSEDASGCVKSEAVNCLFLQKAKDAKRIYADVMHVKTEFLSIMNGETGPRYGFYRSPADTAKFLKTFYDEAGVPPTVVEYVEAFGSAVPEVDKSELEAIDKVFCSKREEPLLVGSVMSNIGYGEAASGISAVTKVLLGYHKGSLAGNLNCSTPRRDVPALQEGRMRVLTDNQHFRRTYAAVNSMSVTGVNAHVLLHGHYKHKDLDRYRANIPRLVTISGRQDTAVERALDQLKSHPIDPEELALLHNIHETNIVGHLGKGYTILDTNSDGTTVSLSKCVEYSDGAQRPLWFVYSGMGSQWAGMGAQLMRIPIFAAAIERCRKVLEPKGIDIVDIITTTDKNIFNNILHSFVGIAAVQIGLTDILLQLGLVPDKIIGHSVGELGCAYADGCLTAEEMILAAYCRGLVSLETTFIRGSMAAVGVGAQKMSLMCPPEIAIACHNSAESCTISGPAETMRSFVAELTAQGIFAKEVPCSNIAYHSKYIAEAGPGLLKYLKEVIKTPRARSERWISSSVPQDKWAEPEAKYSSAEYHTNNLLSPVLFEEASALIPGDAVLVEVAPHGLLQAILKRALPDSAANIPLTRRGHADSVVMLLDAIGKLYLHSFNPKVQILYPKVEFPVSTGTPFLSNYVEWAHQEQWVLPLYQTAQRTMTACCTFVTSIHDDCYLQGHVVGNKTLLPFSYALVAAWDTLAMSLDVPKKSVNVQFRDVKLYTQPILHEQKVARLSISLHRGNGLFEILNEDSKVVTGFITVVESPKIKASPDTENVSIPGSNELSARDVYRIFYERGYSYSGMFRSIVSADSSVSEASISWNDNWVTFINGLIQLNTLKCTHSGVSQPDRIGNMVIDVTKHNASIKTNKNNENEVPSLLNVKLSEVQHRTSCGGVIIENMSYRRVLQTKDRITLQALKFVSKFDSTVEGLSGEEYYLPSGEITTVKEKKALQIEVIGDLNSLRWTQAPELTAPGIVVAIHYTGVNISDVKQALGLILHNNNKCSGFGMDFSGITERDERVMGLLPSGAASSYVMAQPELMWPVPAHWTLEDAATVPLAYVYAYYCLVIKTDLRLVSIHTMHNVNTVLVHGGAGALGQAAISISLARGWRVFTTVGDSDKKRFLMRLFPQLNEADIGNSRDASFCDMVLSATNGKGCNAIISCLQGDLKTASIKCCGTSGITLDTVQILQNENYTYGMFYLTNDRSYVAVDITGIFNNPNSEDINKIHGLVSEGIACGEVRPLTRVTFAPDEAARAFRLLAASRHRGRALLRLADEHEPAQFRGSAEAAPCHIVICDSSALGLQVADKLIDSGIKKLLMHFDKTAQYVHFKIREWEKKNIQVSAIYGSLENIANVSDLLSCAINIGPVEGVHVIAESTLQEMVIERIDLASRNLCPSLKRFIVLSRNVRCGYQTCFQRTKSGLPATLLDLSMLETFKDVDGCTWYCGATVAVDRALQSTNPILLALPELTPRSSLVQQVAVLADLKISDETLNSSTTLEQLGMSKEKSSPVCAFLRDVYNTSLDEAQVPLLTVERLNHIENRSTVTQQVKEVKGLKMFYSFVDSDELLAVTEMVFLPTLTNNYIMRDDESYVTDTYLCIVPGLEGHHERFRTLCERLKLPAFVLQPGLDHPDETPAELALRYSKVLLRKTCLKKTFYILGYETGVAVALELAAILEKRGLTGTVFCLGDGPDETAALLERALSPYSGEAALQEAVTRHVFALMARGTGADVEGALLSCSSWSERVDACVRSLLGHLPHSAQYARALLVAAYARIGAARRAVTPKRVLHSRLVLLRARSEHERVEDTSSLQRNTQQPLHVRDLTVPLAHVAADLRVSAIINSYLDDDILQAFEKKNLCDTYLTNADAFMTVG